jgi:DNA-binding NtrC family response regulator
MLSRYRWPGNVRQLENAIFRAVLLAHGDEITSREFPQMAIEIGDFDAGDRRIPAQMHAMPIDDVGAQQLCEPHIGCAATEVPLLPEDGDSVEHLLMAAMPPGAGSTLNLLNDGGNVRSLQDIEADVIRFALAHYRGQISEVARRLRIGRSTLYRKLETLGCTMANDTGS